VRLSLFFHVGEIRCLVPRSAFRPISLEFAGSDFPFAKGDKQPHLFLPVFRFLASIDVALPLHMAPTVFITRRT